MQSSMLHGSETWPIRNENEVAVQRAEMKMDRWLCGIKLQDRDSSKGLRERLVLDEIILALQQNRLRWYWHVLRKEDNDWGRNVWSMRWKVPRQEIDQRKLGATHTTVLLLVWNMSESTRVSRYQKGKTKKVKTNLDLMEQEIV